VNHSYIEYDGPVAPQRQAFAGPPAGALQEALNATDDMKSIMGIYDASLGARSNETSGVAINARKREGDTSTFNFIDNLSRAIKHAGRILVDMIPHVYNEARIIRVIHVDGDNDEVPINQPMQVQPGQPMPGQPSKMPSQDQAEFNEGMTRVYDLTAGKYDITCEAGPSFNSKREEAAVQMTEFIRSFPAAAPVIGDLIAKNLDWPGADEIGERLRRLLPPAAEGPNPALMQMQQQMQQMDAQAKEAVGQLQQQLQQQQQQLADKQIEQAHAAQKLQIEQFNAETNRIKAMTEAQAAQAEAQVDAMQAVAAMNQPQPVIAQ
jgi:Phage P22-like portal protein